MDARKDIPQLPPARLEAPNLAAGSGYKDDGAAQLEGSSDAASPPSQISGGNLTIEQAAMLLDAANQEFFLRTVDQERSSRGAETVCGLHHDESLRVNIVLKKRPVATPRDVQASTRTDPAPNHRKKQLKHVATWPQVDGALMRLGDSQHDTLTNTSGSIADSDAASETESEAEPVIPLASRSPTMIDSALDERLVRHVLDVRPCSNAIEQQPAAWNRIAAAYTSDVGPDARVKLTSGASAIKRVQYLTEVARDPSHGEHLNVSDALRALLNEYEQVKKPYTPALSSQRRPDRFDRSKPTPREPLAVRTGTPSRRDTTRRSCQIVPALDELLLRLVLDVCPSAQIVGAKARAWDTIAEMWTRQASTSADAAAYGMPKGGGSAKGRMHYLTGVAGDPSHYEYESMTPALKALLDEYKIVKAKNDKQILAQLTQYRRHRAKSSSSSRLTASRAPVSTASSSPSETPTPRTRSASAPPASSVVCENAANSEQDNRDHDDDFLRRLLYLRPFWAHTKRKMPMWDAIAALTRSPSIRNGADAKELVDRLVKVAHDPMQAKHLEKLFLPLKKQLDEYLSLPDNELERAYRRARYLVQKKGTLSVQNLTFDDIVLHEALQLSPQWSVTQWDAMAEELNARFHAKLFPSGEACLDRVRTLLEVYRSGHRDASTTLTRQQEKLLRALDQEDGEPSSHRVAVSNSPSKVGDKRTHPCTSASRGKDREGGARSKRARVADDKDSSGTQEEEQEEDEDAKDEVIFRVALVRQPFRAGLSLRRDAWDAVACEANTQLGLTKQKAFKNGPTVLAHVKRVLDRMETDPESLPMSLRELAAQYNAMLPSPTNTSSRPRRAISSPSPPSTLTPQLSKAPSAATTVTREVPAKLPVHQLQPPAAARLGAGPPRVYAEIAELRDALARLSDRMDVVVDGRTRRLPEVPATTTPMVQLLAQLDRERDEARAQQHALVELLKVERENQRRETRTMVNAIDHERQDRRDEFVAMAKLLAGGAQADPTLIVEL